MGLKQTPTNQTILHSRIIPIPPRVTRLVLGIFGMILPIILVVGNGNKILFALSDYYYTNVGIIFVIFFVIFGLMLILYRGFPESNDDLASTIAGIAAIGIAIFPTTSDHIAGRNLIGWVHSISTLIFVLSLAYMALFLFPINPNGKWKKVIYVISGILMLIAVVGILGVEFQVFQPFSNPTFWYELIAIESFGVSWFLKGI